MTSASELRRAAEKYRLMARQFADPKMVEALTELAAEYEATAKRLEEEDGSRAPDKDPPCP